MTPNDWRTLKAHPAAEVLPMLQREDYSALQESIRGGYNNRFPIILLDNQILDGRNRHQICLELDGEGVLDHPPSFELFDGPDIGLFIVTANIARRHLNKSEKACAVVALRPWFAGAARERSNENLKTDAGPGRGHKNRVVHSEPVGFTEPQEPVPIHTTRQALADLAGASLPTMERAEWIQSHGGETLLRQVAAGQVSMQDALEATGRKRRKRSVPVPDPDPEPLRSSRTVARKANDELRQQAEKRAQKAGPQLCEVPTCQTDKYSRLGAHTDQVGERTALIGAGAAEAANKLAWHFDREGMEGVFFYLREYLLPETRAYVIRIFGEGVKDDGGFRPADG